jgi:hypothetical protein
MAEAPTKDSNACPVCLTAGASVQAQGLASHLNCRACGEHGIINLGTLAQFLRDEEPPLRRMQVAWALRANHESRVSRGAVGHAAPYQAILDEAREFAPEEPAALELRVLHHLRDRSKETGKRVRRHAYEAVAIHSTDWALLRCPGPVSMNALLRALEKRALISRGGSSIVDPVMYCLTAAGAERAGASAPND